MIRKIIKDINLREYFPSPLWCFLLGNLNCNDDCFACLGYPTVFHFSTRNWWSEDEYSIPHDDVTWKLNLPQLSRVKYFVEIKLFSWYHLNIWTSRYYEDEKFLRKKDNSDKFTWKFDLNLYSQVKNTLDLMKSFENLNYPYYHELEIKQTCPYYHKLKFSQK